MSWILGKPLGPGPLDWMQQKSRAVVLFKSGKYMLWQGDDGLNVIEWADSFVKKNRWYPNNLAIAEAEGGCYHAVVYTIGKWEVTYETEHE